MSQSKKYLGHTWLLLQGAGLVVLFGEPAWLGSGTLSRSDWLQRASLVEPVHEGFLTLSVPSKTQADSIREVIKEPSSHMSSRIVRLIEPEQLSPASNSSPLEVTLDTRQFRFERSPRRRPASAAPSASASASLGPWSLVKIQRKLSDSLWEEVKLLASQHKRSDHVSSVFVELEQEGAFEFKVTFQSPKGILKSYPVKVNFFRTHSS